MMIQRPRVIPTVRVVDVSPPIMVQTDMSNFMTVVQELTGNRKNTKLGSCRDNNAPAADMHSPLTNHQYECNVGLLLSDGLSTHWSTSSSSDNSISQHQQEVTSNLITWSHEEIKEEDRVSNMQYNPQPSKKPKLIHTKNEGSPNEDYHHNHPLISVVNMEFPLAEMFSHEETVGFTPPLSFLDHLPASMGLFSSNDLDSDLQSFCDSEIFPFCE